MQQFAQHASIATYNKSRAQRSRMDEVVRAPLHTLLP
jgi:hypothetical protein